MPLRRHEVSDQGLTGGVPDLKEKTSEAEHE